VTTVESEADCQEQRQKNDCDQGWAARNTDSCVHSCAHDSDYDLRLTFEEKGNRSRAAIKSFADNAHNLCKVKLYHVLAYCFQLL
jgi:hypothetical protein